MSPGSSSGSALFGSSDVPARMYDVALLDLDGVVYLGSTAIAGAAAHLAEAVTAGMRLGFVTNNAARSPQEVAEQLTSLGVPADASLVITSAQTAARVLAERIAPGARVLVVGTEALAAEVRLSGLVPVRLSSAPSVDSSAAGSSESSTEPFAAVVQGYSPDTGWRDLAAACRAVRGGAWWVASNADATVPSVDGPLPGNGAFVDVVRATTGMEPVVTGKPEPSMHAECLERMNARHPLVVGDRLDTDIEGAARVGCASMIVLTGVTRPIDLLGAAPQHRPTYLGADLGALLYVHPEVRRQPAGWDCRQWSVTGADRAGADLLLAGSGDHIDALRVLCAGAWETGVTTVRAADAVAAQTLAQLGLPSG